MIGAIIGDIVGSTYEFHNTKNYNFKLFPEGSKYTDDSILSFAIADCLLSGKEEFITSEIFADYLLRYGKKFSHPMGGYGSGFVAWLYSDEHKPYYSCGNGSAMRVSPIGWWFPADNSPTSEKLVSFFAYRSASPTHNHPEGLKGAHATALAIHLARCGKTKEEILNEISLSFGYDFSKSYEEWKKIYKWNGTCQGTVPQAFICFRDSTDFEDAIRKAVSLGGDSDTLACITGSLAEAYYKEIPSFMIHKAIDVLPNELKDILERFQKTVGYWDIVKRI